MRSIARYSAVASSLVILCPAPSAPPRRGRGGAHERTCISTVDYGVRQRRSRAPPGAPSEQEHGDRGERQAEDEHADEGQRERGLGRSVPGAGRRPAAALESGLHLGPGHVEGGGGGGG